MDRHFSPPDYRERVRRRAAATPVVKNAARAFLVGGAICAVGQGLYIPLARLTDPRQASVWVTVILIFAAAALTGLGLFDRLARHAGAGTLLPVTGFANSVVSPALDSRSEGLVLGVGAKIFSIAGPVILYATLAGSLYGLALWVASLFA
ncbi:MAG: SpoVA/SpoVAEb family sporulation membrane protein [Clostridia bacterium]|nr:SpoVA/SpoVAEb family sporulation membrane protein [Clostridia bacterium]